MDLGSIMVSKFVRIVLGCLLIGATSGYAVGKPSGRKAWRVIEQQLSSFETGARDRHPDNQSLGDQLIHAENLLNDFVQNYPKDKHWWKAQIMLPGIRTSANRLLASPVRWAEALNEIQAILANPDLPSKYRPDAEHMRIGLLRSKLAYEGLSDQESDDLARYLRSFADAFPEHAFADEIHYELGLRLIESDPDRAAKAFRAASKSSNPQLSANAARELAVLPYRSTPLDLKFTALDGREVEVEKLKGKVLLIDFWATWCKPCIAEVPRIKDIYQRYHDQGFEIIGISFDQSRGDLKEYLRNERITWPQYFDGGGWNTKIGRRFSIGSIPTMWLVDKQGRVVSTTIRGHNLEANLKAQLQQE